ncbi:unnamed protein product [Polarella glacialis]|uniref:Transmembrane protein n=1 Tax=Polarella glacialis TaxID=89957 RepID=A0A813EQ49_POLGL|nr:unnamed protein product [Polarella glacialis]
MRVSQIARSCIMSTEMSFSLVIFFPGVILSIVIAVLSSSLAVMELFDLRGVRLGVVRVLCSCSFFFLVVCLWLFLSVLVFCLCAGLGGFLSSFFAEYFRP